MATTWCCRDDRDATKRQPRKTRPISCLQQIRGFFEILLPVCVKVAQISKYVAAKSYLGEFRVEKKKQNKGFCFLGFFSLYESKVLLLSHYFKLKQ